MATAKKKADEIYVRLKDKSTSFHDISQGKNVVADRIVAMKRTSKVAQALHHNVLIEVDDDEAEAYFSKAEKTAGKVAKKTTLKDEDDDDDEKEEKVSATKKAAKKAADKKPTGDKEVAKKKSDLTADDDDE